jgi:hypothetical protein
MIIKQRDMKAAKFLSRAVTGGKSDNAIKRILSKIKRDI